MEYCEASPDPPNGVGGYYSPTTTEDVPDGYKENTNCEASIEDASPLPTIDYSNLYIPTEVERHFDSMSQGTEMPNNVLTEDEDDQTDPDQDGETSQERWEVPVDPDKESDEDTMLDGDWIHENQGVRAKNAHDDWLGSQGQLAQQETHQWDSENEQEDGEGTDHWTCGSDENEPSVNSSSESGTEWSEGEDQKEDRQHKERERKLRSVKPNLKSKSVSGPQPVLCFDEYGNLTTSYQRAEEPHSSQELSSEVGNVVNELASHEAVENAKMHHKVDTKYSKRKKGPNFTGSDEPNDALSSNGEAKALRSKPKVRHESGEGSLVSDLELKQAFKEDFMTAAMSRYGRARKRKTEDGFFFGTLNFNELRKITSNSPKKNKGSNSKNSSPDQKSKVSSKEEARVRLRLDEAVDSEIQSWQVRSEEGDQEEVDDASKVQKLSEAKDGNELVQSRVDGIQERENDIIKGCSDSYNFRESRGNSVQGSSRVLENEIKSSIPDHHFSDNSLPMQYKEVRSAGVNLDTSDSKERNSEESVDSTRVERRKRLSLRKRSENSVMQLRTSERIERLSRRQSDVTKEECVLQASDTDNTFRKRLRRSHTFDIPLANESTTSCTDSQDSQDELWGTAKVLKSPSEVTHSVEDKVAGELASTTKSGRTVRKPQIMDVSDEEKRQKQSREQLRQSEALLNSSLEYDLVASGIDMHALEQEHPCEYLVGDLVWVHIRGSPLWPAMVSYHPRMGQYTKISVAQNWYKIRSVRMYHVQFFSDNAQTYWIAPINVLPFEGLPKLRDYLSDLKSKAKEMKKSKKSHIDSLLKTLVHINKITTGQKHERWIRAIEEGKTAMALDRYERIQKYALEYPEIEPSDDVSVKKLISKHSMLKSQSSNLEGRPEKKRRGRPRKYNVEKKLSSKPSKSNGDSTDGEFSGFDENSSFEEKKRRLALTTKLSKEGSFKVYAQKHLPKIMQDFPNISEETARNKLRWRWKKMSSSQTTRYKSKFSSSQNEGLNDTMKRKYEPSFENFLDDDSGASAAKRKRTEEYVENLRGVYKVVRNEKVCYRCESVSTKGGSDMVRCKGLCCGVFHLECIGLSSHPKRDFKCEECLTGQHKCFLCRSPDGILQRCTVPFCGKFYHERCIQKWPHVSKQRQQERFVCPRHVCHMCAANADDMGDPVARTPPFTRCLRCPTTYHTGEECIAAGTEEISQQHHICTKHLTLPKNTAHHVNVNWCFCCSKGGSLLLCDQCPAAFHADCIKITAPEGGYVCEDCENGKVPVYGDIVWVKLGIYRWWPGQVLHPRFIPDNIENLPHQQGMFCVHFFGSNDYYWVTKGRAFHYQEGDKGSKAASSKTLEKQFQKALEEAVEAYRAQKIRKAQQEAHRSEKGNLKPPPYVRIDSNRPVGNVRLSKVDLAAVNRCDCDPDSENPCGSDEKCLNRMLMFECMREVCGAGDKCGNQRFQKRLYPNLCCFKTESRGWGLKALEDIKKGQFVIEYVGELIDDEEFRRRIEEMHKVKEENYYFLTIDKDIMIDAGPKGNLARFMNHSCQPNCETQKWTVGGDTRVGLFSICDIPAGSELTFNYNLQCVGTEKKRCSCGAPNCSGFIGVKVQKQTESQGPKREKLAKRKRKRRRREAKMSEDECFRCGSHGDLILCDVAACPKGYHLQCLGLEKLPKGKWICPWHHCDECGQRSTRLNRCDFCPNSFCRQHLPGNLQTVSGIGNVCQEHDPEELEALRGQMEMEANEALLSVDHSEQPVAEAEADKYTVIGSSATKYKDFAETPEDVSEKALIEGTSKSIVNGVLAIDSSAKVPEEHDAASPKKSATILPLQKKIRYGRTQRFSKVPDGPENSSAVINVSGDILEEKSSAKHSGPQRALKTVARKTVRSKRAQSDSVAKPVNEA